MGEDANGENNQEKKDRNNLKQKKSDDDVPFSGVPTRLPPQYKFPKQPGPFHPGVLIPEGTTAIGITLPDALRLAYVANLDIQVARQLVNQAVARQLQAKTLTLPTIGFDTSFVDHEGRIQQANGNILDVNRNSLFTGGTLRTVFNFGDALFAPIAAKYVVAASEAGQQRVANKTIHQVAQVYFSVLRGRRRLARAKLALDFMADQSKSDLRADVKGLLPLIKDFVDAGNASPAEQARVEVDVLRRQDEAVQGLRELRVAMADLTKLLQLPPGLMVVPLEDYRFPLPVPGQDWANVSVESLVEFALNTRPEIAENQAIVQAT